MYLPTGASVRNYRIGLESEFWVVKKDQNGDYVSCSIRNNDKFCEELFKLGGDLEYQNNVFELRSSKDEERSTESVEEGLVKRLGVLRKLLPKDAYALGGGTYNGIDEPPLDISQSADKKGNNVFWSEFNISYPADVSTRYTASNQVCISPEDGSKKDIVNLYNRFAGLSPLIIYAFSNSPIINGVNVYPWCRREQIVESKGVRANTIIPGTYPLKDLRTYRERLDDVGDVVEKTLAETNPFFILDGKSSKETVSYYRSNEWGFYKLITDQMLRFNYGHGKNPFLEIRCFDMQECPSKMASLTSLVRNVAEAKDGVISQFLPRTEKELRFGVGQAILLGDRGEIEIGGVRTPLVDYSKKFCSTFIDKEDKYSNLLRETILSPKVAFLRKYVLEGGDVVELLSDCLRNNVPLPTLTKKNE